MAGHSATTRSLLVSGGAALRNHNAAFTWARRGVALFSPFISDNAFGVSSPHNEINDLKYKNRIWLNFVSF